MSQEVLAWPGAGPTRQSAAVSDRHGGLRRRASPQSHTKGTWAPSTSSGVGTSTVGIGYAVAIAY